MVTVGKRIQQAIDYMDKGEVESALTEVCIAIDITSQKHFGIQSSQKSKYKEFLEENLDIIIPTWLGGVVLPDFKIPYKINDKVSKDGYSSIQDIVYELVRCGLIHSTGEDSHIVWTPRVGISINNGDLVISPTLVWGLILAVVTSDENVGERVTDTCWISTCEFRYFVNDLWGQKSKIKRMISVTYGI